MFIFLLINFVLSLIVKPPDHLLFQQTKKSTSENDWIKSAFSSSTHVHFEPRIWIISLNRQISIDKFHQLVKTSKNITLNERFRFDSILFYGFSFELSIDQDISSTIYSISNIENILNIYPTFKHNRPNTIIQSNSTGLFNLSNYNSPALSQFTGVQQVHNSGQFGQGVKVAIIDSGVDFNHPALGGCFGPGCKVAFGYDLVGDEYGTEGSKPIPDKIPLDCDGHGTHVAGIIGANDPNSTLRGVAYRVTLGAYRIFGCTGGASDDVIMKAYELAYIDKMNIINLSLGDGPGWPETPSALAAQRFAETGAILSIAAGNNGDLGLYEVSVPSVANLATSVASFDNTEYFGQVFTLDTNPSRKISFTTTFNGTLNFDLFSNANLVPVSNYSTINLPSSDACSDNITGDYSGKIVLVRRGSCYFSTKAYNIQKRGAIAVIIYNNVLTDEVLAPSIDNSSVIIPVFGISSIDGLFLLKAIQKIQHKLIWIKEMQVLVNPTGKQISSFSSLGLSSDFSVKPDIGAPGGLIYSTFPLNKGGYTTLSGTSMATPYITGCFALLMASLQLKKVTPRKLIPIVAQGILQNGATPMKHYNRFDGIKGYPLESIVKQGSGMVNISKSILSKLGISPGKISLGSVFSTTNISKTVNIYLINFSNETLSVVPSSVFALSVNSDDVNSPVFYKQREPGILVSFLPNMVNISPLGTQMIVVKFDFVTPLKSTKHLLILNGFLNFNFLSENITVPYAALIGPINRRNILGQKPSPESDGTGFPQLLSASSILYSGGRILKTFNKKNLGNTSLIHFKNLSSIYSFSLNSISVDGNISYDIPTVRLRLEFGTPLLLLRVFNATSEKLVGVVSSFPFVGRNDEGDQDANQNQWIDIPWFGNVTSNDPFSSVHAVSKNNNQFSSSIGSLISRKLSDLKKGIFHNFFKDSRDRFSSVLFPAESNDTTVFMVPNGNYVLELSAMKPDFDSFEVWYSPVFTIDK